MVVIENPFQIIDWRIGKFLRFVLVIQLITLALFGLSLFGINIPILSQFIGFIYAILIPGLIILRILRLHKLVASEMLIYSVGLSLAFDMFLGFLINMLYPFIGIVHPLSSTPLITTWTVVLGLLCFVAYMRDRSFSYPTNFKLGELLSPSVLFFVLLPLLAVVGTQAVNFYGNNVILLALIALITITALVVILTKFIQPSLYPLAVFSIALALLWHYSLISSYLTGYDIFNEYYFYSLVSQSGSWNAAIPHTYNSMLSITILPTILSHFLQMTGEQIFKIIYPCLYALVPLGLYTVYNKLFANKHAFAAVFFFMAISVFYLIMPSLARQVTGELFCVLLIMLIIDREASVSKKALFIVFAAGLAVSHYALSYIYMGFLFFTLIVLYALKKKTFHITIYSVMLLMAICLAWYMYTAGAVPLASLARITKQIYGNLFSEFLNPFSRDVSMIFMQTSPNPLHLVYRILYYLMLFFLAVGALRLIQHLRQRGSQSEYFILAAFNYILLAACMIVPFFSEKLGNDRMFHLSVMVLAPFCILGIKATFDAVARLTRPVARLFLRLRAEIAMGVILAIFFLFDSGFAFEVTHNPFLQSLPLSLTAIEDPQRNVYLINKIRLRYICPTAEEIFGAKWLSMHIGDSQDVYATFLDIRVPALVAYGLIPEERTLPLLPPPPNEAIGDGYVYLGYVNTVFDYGVTNPTTLGDRAYRGPSALWHISQISPLLYSYSKVYENGAAETYKSP